MIERLRKFIPVLDWGRTYNGAAFSNDLVAAVIVTIMLIPQSLAYARLAGLPPEAYEGSVRGLAGMLKQDRVDAVFLTPV